MATVTTKKNMVMLTNITEADRDVLAILALKGRLSFAIRVGRTDGVALAKTRQLAAKYNWPEGMKTMKQAERFVLAAHEAWKN
ncbi:hypothetical protein SEA_ZOOMAN_352 [Microbacterium phage Zooman]|nr:hypothetical protein SEA_ZOOMAN_39 [Microbacterium phage Zooman]UDL16593.1 hypothetical protein SEA_ZOOMAN_352 [Microbacterium phage Zooman]